MSNPWYVYLVECSDGSLYCGISKDVARRVLLHNLGDGSKYVRSRRPCRLVAHSGPMTKSEALRSEALIKKLPRIQKPLVVKRIGNGVRVRGPVGNSNAGGADRARRDRRTRLDD